MEKKGGVRDKKPEEKRDLPLENVRKKTSDRLTEKGKKKGPSESEKKG